MPPLLYLSFGLVGAHHDLFLGGAAQLADDEATVERLGDADLGASQRVDVHATLLAHQAAVQRLAVRHHLTRRRVLYACAGHATMSYASDRCHEVNSIV